MWRFVVIAIVVIGMGTVGRGEDTKSKDDLTIAGVAVVPAPAEGYTWKKIQESGEGEKPKSQIFVAGKDGSTSKVVLIVEETTADTDAKKLARIKGDYNGMVSSLKEQGYTNLKAIQPPLTPPFGERVSFSLTGKDKDGAFRAFHSTLVFGKSVFHFQVAAGSEDESKKLAKVAESIKEKTP